MDIVEGYLKNYFKKSEICITEVTDIAKEGGLVLSKFFDGVLERESALEKMRNFSIVMHKRIEDRLHSIEVPDESVCRKHEKLIMEYLFTIEKSYNAAIYYLKSGELPLDYQTTKENMMILAMKKNKSLHHILKNIIE